MPPPIGHTPSNLKSIHLLRALLREASYLPDANARTFFRRHILDRFKAYQPGRNAVPTVTTGAGESGGSKHGGSKKGDISLKEDRTRSLQRLAQKRLNYFRRANLGERACLERVMHLTYGRMGKRKYALLEKLLQPDPMDGDREDPVEMEVAPLQQVYHSEKRFLQYFDAPKPDGKRSVRHQDLGPVQQVEERSREPSEARHLNWPRSQEAISRDAEEQLVGTVHAHQASPQRCQEMVCCDHDATATSIARCRVGPVEETRNWRRSMEGLCRATNTSKRASTYPLVMLSLPR